MRKETRRQFIAQASALGAAALLPGCGAMPGAEPRRIIDTHHHFYAPEYQKAWLDWEAKRNIPHFPSQVAWSRAATLKAMDKGGVQPASPSLAPPPGALVR